MNARYMSCDLEVMSGALYFKAHVSQCKISSTTLKESPHLRSSCKTFPLCLEKLP